MISSKKSDAKGIRCLLAVVLLVVPGIVFGQDAGSILRDYRDSLFRQPAEIPKEEDQIEQQQPASPQDVARPVAEGPAVQVEAINVVGNTTLGDEALHAVLAPYTGRQLTTGEIHAAADALMQAIRDAGAFAARVYILPQDVVDGTVTFNVIEGHLAQDGIVLGRSSSRVDDDVILEQLAHTLQPGTVITQKKYERAIYLTNDLPGVKSTENILFPAEEVGEAGFQVIPEDDNAITGIAYGDNFGSVDTGRNRLGTTLFVNSPSGRAELITVGGNVSDVGTVFGFIDGSIPLYPNGLRGGIYVDYLDYQTDDEPLDPRGTGLDAALYLHYPLVRSRTLNVYGNLRYGYGHLEDENDLGPVTDRELQVGSFELSGDASDVWMGGGVTTFALAGYVGDLNLDGFEPNREFDARHADTQGGFSRATLNLTRLQHVVGNLQAYLAFNGQVASGHMDSSQSISFGGPFSFPGYSSGDVFGDDGWMLHGDLRYTIHSPPWGGDLQVSVFYDYGRLQGHVTRPLVAGVEESEITMQSTGLGVSQTWRKFQLQGILGWQVDNEVPATLLDDDSDFQGWIHLVYAF